jgi:hypothetical protein
MRQKHSKKFLFFTILISALGLFYWRDKSHSIIKKTTSPKTVQTSGKKNSPPCPKRTKLKR